MATRCGIEDSVMPLVGRQRLQAAQDRRATPPDGDEPEAALVQFREDRRLGWQTQLFPSRQGCCWVSFLNPAYRAVERGLQPT